MGHFYAAEPSDWDRVAAALERQTERGRPAGLDSEFYNVNVYKESCVARSRIHVWSVAVHRWPLVLHPRGYYAADSAVLPAAALEHQGLRRWLESTAPKVVHNLAVDDHSFANAGVSLGGTINTLARARFCFPERARGAGFDLDGLGTDILGVGKTEDGWCSEDTWRKRGKPLDPAIFVRIVQEKVTRLEKSKTCSCGVEKCRKRKGHERPEIEVAEVKLRFEKIPLEEVVPGHERWERLVAYAARDPLLALWLWDRMERMMTQGIPFPWSA